MALTVGRCTPSRARRHLEPESVTSMIEGADGVFLVAVHLADSWRQIIGRQVIGRQVVGRQVTGAAAP